MKKTGWILILLCFSSFTLSGGNADEPAISEGGQSTQEALYAISTGDTIDIQVYQESDLSGDFSVNEDGTISYPLLGIIQAAGITAVELEKNITDLLEKDYLVNPFVRVKVKKYKTLEGSIMIMGTVRNPGSFTLTADRPLMALDAISLAGGFNASADINGAVLIRTRSDGKKETSSLFLDKVFTGEKQDTPLQSGDMISVPELEKITVTVLGSVKNPGTYAAPDYKGLTLTRAISLAGGFTNMAAIKKVKIIRTDANNRKVTLETRLDSIFKGEQKDIELQNGDLVTVPERFF
ncbi:MAG: Polysaccharide biosynthesis/export protein [Candidatus Omnitrophica bacterium ADurb.Bin277]|nr:MAG: Polysaccharide biosynthesis/export protein [Candidatus Omnitrophica bacterium ADurb.Bin277]